MAYDFTTLAPGDFEALVADLLTRSWGGRLESFKAGKDGGIDLRHSRIAVGEPTTIVQCKRYAPHKFAELLNSVRKEQVNLQRLQPQRYVLATSVGLTPANKDTIVAALAPWCKSTADIYGPEELNGLLRDYPEVERAHFKLWISSTALLERVLHAKIFAVTDATVDATKQQLSKLVVHEGLARALDLLHQRRHVLIVGNPGIGKTTLARMLMCHYMRENFEPVWVVGNIEDAWAIVQSTRGSDRKLVIVYDDFLGRLQFDSHRFGKNEDHSLMDLLDKVAHSPNLRFILTTREYILADAKRVHGAFDMRADELLRCTLSLEDYTRVHRANMIFNHLYFSDLPNSRLEYLLERRVYRDIVAHEHFNPRVVESISKYANSRAMSDEEYIAFIKREFDNPSKLWKHPFLRDISPMARQVLAVLWSFRGCAELSDLRSSVARLNGQAALEEFAIQFDDALRQLDGNFIQTGRYPGINEKAKPFMVVQFQNPSVEEFVDGLLQELPEWLHRVAEAAETMRQVEVIADRARKVRASNQLTSYFWPTLRSRATECERANSGHLVNFIPYGQKKSRSTWFIDSVVLPDVIRELLQIEADTNANDERTAMLRAHVLTVAGWSAQISDAPYQDSVAYAAARLQKWVVEASGWSATDIKLSEECLRAALVLLLQNNNGTGIAVSSLESLVKASMLVTPVLQDKERKAIAGAVKSTVRGLVRDSDDPNVLNDEASEVEALANILGIDMREEIANLLARADELDEGESDEESYDPEQHRPFAEAVEDFDVDVLFDGLLDR